LVHQELVSVSKKQNSCQTKHVAYFTFTFIHLADTFIQMRTIESVKLTVGQ